MNDRSDEAIKDLCISYGAYMDAIRKRTDHAIAAWAHCLISDQERTGVEMISYTRLREDINCRIEEVGEVY